MKFIADLKKAKNLQNQRLFTEAELIYKKIIYKDKNNFDANLGLAILYYLDHKVLLSIKLFKKLIQNYPNRPETYYNFSNILIFQKNFKEAIVNLLNAYKIDKKNIKILENLAYLYFQTNNFEKVKKYSELGLKLDLQNYFIYNILGQVYFKQDDINKSIDYFKLSIHYNNLFWSAYDNLLTIYEQINNLKDLKKLLNQANKLFNNSENLIRLKYFQALLFFRNNDFTKSLDLLKQIEDNFTYKNSKHLQSFYDLLGKNYDKLEKYNLAFSSFNIRNKNILNLEENNKYNKKILLNLITDYSKYFVKKNIKRYNLYKKIDDNSDPVFLIGFPRSGTTLLDTILRSHSQTIVLEEKPYIANIRNEYFKSNKNQIKSLENIELSILEKIRKDYFNNIKYLNKNNSQKIIIDKLPLNIIEIGFIKRIFPNSKFILMMRHPCDSVLSCFTTNFSINEAMIHFLKINDTVKLYTEVFNLWQQYKKNLDINFHIIKYEDIIFDLKKNIINLLTFLNLQWEENILHFNEVALKRNRINTPSYNQVIKPLNSESIGRWKKYKEIKNIENKLAKWIEYFQY